MKRSHVALLALSLPACVAGPLSLRPGVAPETCYQASQRFAWAPDSRRWVACLPDNGAVTKQGYRLKMAFVPGDNGCRLEAAPDNGLHSRLWPNVPTANIDDTGEMPFAVDGQPYVCKIEN